MIMALYIAAAVIMAVGSLYFAWRNRDFRKFLTGAFFVSSEGVGKFCVWVTT